MRKDGPSTAGNKSQSLPEKYCVVETFEMRVTGHNPVATGPGSCKDDGIDNPAFETFAPEFPGKDCNRFRHRKDKAPYANLKNNLADIFRTLPFLVKEFNQFGKSNR